jgi:sulfite reductase beta subunit-like hemoprotein
LESFSLEIEDLERFVGKYSLGTDRGMGSKHFLRVKVPGGLLNSYQLKGIAELSEKYGRGYAEITNRQDIQLHWINEEWAPEIFSALEKLGFTTDMCGQAYPGARYGDVRNILSCPISGHMPGELLDVRPFVKKLSQFFTGKREYLDLPRKFKISISGCPLNCVKPGTNDLDLVAIKNDESIGFTALVGGSSFSYISTSNLDENEALSKPLGIFLEPDPELILEFVKALVELYRDFWIRNSKPKARFRWMVNSWGIEKLRKALEEKLGFRLKDYKTSLELPWNDHYGIHRQSEMDTFYVVIPTIVGIASGKLLRAIAEVSEMYGSGDLSLTTCQKIVVLNVSSQNLEHVKKELIGLGLNLDEHLIAWKAIACPGDLCGKALESPKGRIVDVLNSVKNSMGYSLKNLDVHIYASGCANGCGRHVFADIGLQALRVKLNGEVKPAYKIFLTKGSKLAKPLKGFMLAEDLAFFVEKLLRDYLASNEQSFKAYASKQINEIENYLISYEEKLTKGGAQLEH